MISKLVNYYNGQYAEDKIIIWLFMFFEVYLTFFTIIFYFMYTLLLVLVSTGPD